MKIDRPWRPFVELALAGLLAAGAGGPLTVAPEALAQSDPAAIVPDPRTHWREKAADVRARMAAALLREQDAREAYSRMLTRNYPVGDAKLAIIDERDVASRKLAEARAEVREFKQQARSAGVPDSWIDPDDAAPSWWVDPES